MTRRMALTIPVAFVLVLALVATAGASHGRIYVASQDCLGHTSRPVQITIDCFTGQFYAGNLHYSAYGGRVARGAGRLYLDDCRPNCAKGKFQSEPATVTLRDVIRCSGRLLYGRISWRYRHLPSEGGAYVLPARTGSAKVGPSRHCPDWGLGRP